VSRVTSRLAAVFCGAVAQAVAFAAFAQTATAAVPNHPFAAPQSLSQPVTPSAGGLARVTLALLAVLVAVFVVAWIVRRMRGFGTRSSGDLDVIADIALGAKERAVLLKVGQKQILLGVAPGRVNTLHVLEEPLDPAKPAAGPSDSRPSFKSLMLRSLGK
jgi:flagellar protein FliO/FliZ